MKNKILKAINEALLNALSTDISDQNIDFNSPDVNNEFVPEITLDELSDKLEYVNPNVLIKQKFNTKNAISLILEDDSEISLYELFSPDRIYKPVFLKITNTQLKKANNDIYIYVKDIHKITYGSKWLYPCFKQILTDGEKSKNGYRQFELICDKIYSQPDFDLGLMPAGEQCKRYYINGYQGYLPNILQMKTISKYIKLINYIMPYVKGEKIDCAEHGWWTSEEATSFDAWSVYINDVHPDDVVRINVKNYDGYVLPLFKKTGKPLADKYKKNVNENKMSVLSTDISDQDIDFNHSDIENTCVEKLYSLKQLSDADCILQRYDTSDILTLILTDGTEISLHEYKGQNVELINFKACNENGNIDTIFHKDLSYDSSCTWVTTKNMLGRIHSTYEYKDCIEYSSAAPAVEKYAISMAANDFDGYKHTYENADILKNHRKLQYYPAITYCREQNFLNYSGYMPSCGQMTFLFKYENLINRILSFIGSPETFETKICYWTSTEASARNAWIIGAEKTYIANKSKLTYYNQYIHMHMKYVTMPLFKKLD